MEFEEANCVFKAKLVELKRLGKAKFKYKPPIAHVALKKLYNSKAYDMSTPSIVGGATYNLCFAAMICISHKHRLVTVYMSLYLPPLGGS